jgi:DNA-binding NarL/FixJ family response regulator
MSPVKLALVDDHDLLRKGLKSTFQTIYNCEVKIEARNGIELFEKMSRQKVDLVVTDLSMPGMNGFEVVKIMGRDHKNVKVVILSLYDHLLYVKQLVADGALGYILKSAEIPDIVQCFEKVMKGELAFCKQTTEMLLKSALKKNQDQIELTERDVQILKLVFDDKSNEEISKILEITPRREQMLMQELMEKLGVSSRVGMVKWVYEHGW